MNAPQSPPSTSALANAILDKLARQLEDHQHAINKKAFGHFTKGSFLNGSRYSFCPCSDHGTDGKDTKPSLSFFFTETYDLKFKCTSSSSCTSDKIVGAIKSLGFELMDYNSWSPINPELAKVSAPSKSRSAPAKKRQRLTGLRPVHFIRQAGGNVHGYQPPIPHHSLASAQGR